jgi:hypothetical protein
MCNPVQSKGLFWSAEVWYFWYDEQEQSRNAIVQNAKSLVNSNLIKKAEKNLG